MSPKRQDDEEVLDIDADTPEKTESEDEEFGDVDAALSKIKKLKKELSSCKSEKQEYLDGWQRLKADVANARKMDTERSARAHSAAQEAVVSDLIPIIDNFDMARQGESWNRVDSTWRTGVEAIISQIEQLMASYGAERLGKVGDTFDPKLHEAVSEERANSSEQNGKIVAILRSGWKIGESVLRPAQVTVAGK